MLCCTAYFVHDTGKYQPADNSRPHVTGRVLRSLQKNIELASILLWSIMEVHMQACGIGPDARNAFQRWTVHFGMSDVFQRFLGHLEPLNQNPSDATLAPLSILQNSRWRPRWPTSEWNYWNDHIFFVITVSNANSSKTEHTKVHGSPLDISTRMLCYRIK